MNITKNILSLSFCFLFITTVYSQENSLFKIERNSEVHLNEIEASWHPKVYSTEAPFPGSDSYRSYIHQLKSIRFDGISNLLQSSNPKKIANSELPIFETSFNGNPFDGIPNDNDIAISNAGIIVSVSNSDMYVYDESGNSLYNTGLESFADSLGLVANSYDPKIMYDPDEDKFILVFLNGNSASSTNIIVCFSQTDDPTLGWNVYNLPGNPYNNNAWSDFPMVAMTQQDFFVTVNHINSDSASWQTGFMQSVIWQVQKEEGYVGDSIITKTHSAVNYNNKPLRNLLPIKGGVDIKSEEMYFISNRNFDFYNDTFFLVKIEQSLNTNSNVSFQTSALIASQDYGLPPDAKQTASSFLQTNDARALSGLIENSRIHFVGNTVNPSTNLASIFHGQIDLTSSNLSVDLEIVSDTVLEYGYPNLSFSGQNTYDDQVLISFNHTSIDSFPGMSALFYHQDDGYSNRLHIKSGTSNVDVISGSNYERWGDYSGSQRKFNEAGTVWVNGFIGEKNFIIFQDKRHRTFIAKIASPDSLHTSISNPDILKTKLFPNPTNERFFLQFDMDKEQILSFDVYNVEGKLIKHLMSRKVKAGANELIFSTAFLSSGNYFLKVTDLNNKVLIQDKIIKF